MNLLDNENNLQFEMQINKIVDQDYIEMNFNTSKALFYPEIVK